jgi:hypothetical protein
MLGPGVRVVGSSPVPQSRGLAVDLHVHMPQAPEGTASAEVIYHTVHVGKGRYTIAVDHISWFRADGSPIGAAA